MFQFPHLPPPRLWVQRGVTGHDPRRVAPFGHRRRIACLRPTVAFRSLPRPSSARVAEASTAYRFLLERDASRPRPCPAAAREPSLATARHHLRTLRPQNKRKRSVLYLRSMWRRLFRTSIRPVLTRPQSHLHLLTSPPTTGPDGPSTDVAARASWCAAPTRAGRWPWVFLDSNQRPLPYQGSALTT